MRIIIFCFCFVGSVVALFGQERPLVICKTKVEASLPFYEIRNVAYYWMGKWHTLESQHYNKDKALWVLSTGATFSFLDGTLSDESIDNQGLKEAFEIAYCWKKSTTNYRQMDLAVYLVEKDEYIQRLEFRRVVKEYLKKEFPAYKLSIELQESRRQEKTTLTIQLISATGGDEFETTQAQKERIAKMKKEVEPNLQGLIRAYHTRRLQALQKTVIEPYRARIRAKQQPQKLETITIDIEELGNYSADKEVFYDVKCKDGWRLRRLEAPLIHAKKLRDAPKEYQIKAHLFQGRMSHPWCPNQDLTAFGFYEIVHKETQKLLVRTKAYFEHPAGAKYHRFHLTFPQF